MIEQIKFIQRDVDYRKLKIRGCNNVNYDFSDYKTFKELFRDFYYRKITIYDPGIKQDEFDRMLYHLNKYTPKNLKYIEVKNNGKIFPIYRDEALEEGARYEEEEENIRNENGLINYKKLARPIDPKIRDVSDELVRKYFLVQDLGDLLEKFQKSKNNFEKNKIQVNLINSGKRDLRKENEDMSEQEKEIKNPYEIVDLVENIFKFNRQ